MKNLCAILFLCLIASGCAGNPVIKKEFDREGEVLNVTIKTYQGERRFKNAVRNYTRGKSGEAVYSPDDNVCEISLVRDLNIKVDEDFTSALGHELMHCLYGDYHD